MFLRDLKLILIVKKLHLEKLVQRINMLTPSSNPCPARVKVSPVKADVLITPCPAICELV
jgi:hypothetical protein